MEEEVKDDNDHDNVEDNEEEEDDKDDQDDKALDLEKCEDTFAFT